MDHLAVLLDQLGKSNIIDFYIMFDKQLFLANKSVKYFQEQFQLADGQFGSDDFELPNKMKIYLNETLHKGRSKQNISYLIQKYSKPKQQESSDQLMQICQREPFLIVIVFCKEDFISFQKIEEIVGKEKQKEQVCKIILIFEEIKELIFSSKNYFQYQQEFDNFLLDLQLTYKVDVILTKSKKQTLEEIFSCLSCGIQLKKKKDKVPCLFRDRQGQIKENEKANEHESYWVSMLMQIPGISEAKAKSIVKQYPTIKSLINAYQQTPVDDRPYMLSEIDVQDGIIQQKNKKLGNKISEILYSVFQMRDPEFQLFDQ